MDCRRCDIPMPMLAGERRWTSKCDGSMVLTGDDFSRTIPPSQALLPRDGVGGQRAIVLCALTMYGRPGGRALEVYSLRSIAGECSSTDRTSRSPGCGFPTAALRSKIVIVPSGLFVACRKAAPLNRFPWEHDQAYTGGMAPGHQPLRNQKVATEFLVCLIPT